MKVYYGFCDCRGFLRLTAQKEKAQAKFGLKVRKNCANFVHKNNYTTARALLQPQISQILRFLIADLLDK